MRIVSWNLWWRYGPWKRRQDAIAATLAETGPDVCGLPEVWEAPGENLAAELAGRLGMHWCWAAASSGRDERGEELSIGNAILSLLTKIASGSANFAAIAARYRLSTACSPQVLWPRNCWRA